MANPRTKRRQQKSANKPMLTEHQLAYVMKSNDPLPVIARNVDRHERTIREYWSKYGRKVRPYRIKPKPGQATCCNCLHMNDLVCDLEFMESTEGDYLFAQDCSCYRPDQPQSP